MTVSPSNFVVVDERVEVLFDEDQWFVGTISKVHDYCEDDDGPYVLCDITYADGTIGENTRLYDYEFNEDLIYGWRFASNMNQVLQAMDAIEESIPVPSPSLMFIGLFTLAICYVYNNSAALYEQTSALYNYMYNST